VSGATSNAATPLAGSGTRGTASAAAPAGDAPRSTEATLTRLRQVMDRVRGGYARDLSGAEAAQAVVGQSATARRERGEAAPREGEYLVPVGTVMAAVLDMEINSDWEGRWRAMITRDVHDLGQDVILIPKGTRVLGTSVRPKPVNEAINERMALVAQWLVLPNGARIDLNRSTMLDGAGVAALEGDVNRHFLATLGGVVAYGVIGGWGAAQAAKAARDDVGTAAIYGAIGGGRSAGAEIAHGLSDIGKRVASRYLNLVPTITIKPGASMNIFLDDEMYLDAWAPIDEFAPAVHQPPPPSSSMRAARR
jgi:type IV secretory pathway VirB10-like protein